MSRPTPEQLQTALNAAAELRATGDDDQHLARSLLYLQQRNKVLEPVLDAALRYLNSGQDPHTHARLLRAVEAARHQSHDESSSLDADSAFGLE